MKTTNAMTSIFASSPRSASMGRAAIQTTLPASPVLPGTATDRLLLKLAATTLVCVGLVVALSFPQRARAAMDDSRRSIERLQQYETLSTGTGLASLTARRAIQFQEDAGAQPGPSCAVPARHATHAA